MVTARSTQPRTEFFTHTVSFSLKRMVLFLLAEAIIYITCVE